jgi:hypothetical protein
MNIFQHASQLQTQNIAQVRFIDGTVAYLPILSITVSPKEKVGLDIPDHLDQLEVIEVTPAPIDMRLMLDCGFQLTEPINIAAPGVQQAKYAIAISSNTTFFVEEKGDGWHIFKIQQRYGQGKKAEVHLGTHRFFYLVQNQYTLLTQKKLQWKQTHQVLTTEI